MTYLPPSVIALFEDVDSGYVRNAEEWPTFLYAEQAGWSDKDIKNGLFRGHVLSRVSSGSCSVCPTFNQQLQLGRNPPLPQ